MGKTILIVEDEIDTARAYANLLTENGYNSVIAYNGLQGLEKLKKIHPDMILLDLGMPKMNGIEFYQKICDANEKPLYPVLIITGRTDLEDLFEDLHVEGLLIKPVQQKRLLTFIKVVLTHQNWKKKDGTPRKVIIVDDIQASANKIHNVLALSGFNSEVANSGLSGIVKIMENPPDLAIISLGLNDLSGDLVILKLLGSRKMKNTQFVLYIRKNDQHDVAIMEHFAHKKGVKIMCEYEKADEILKTTTSIFNELQE